eukprot:PhF_6_TR42734/c0_g1_i4/m.64583
MSDLRLELARKQRIHNLKLKVSCLEIEEYIQELHNSDPSGNKRQTIYDVNSKAQELLKAVEDGTEWTLIDLYDLTKFMRVCGLVVPLRKLNKPEDKPKLSDIAALMNLLRTLKEHPSTGLFSGLIDNFIVKVEKIEELLRNSQLDSAPLMQILQRIVKKVEGITTAAQIRNELAGPHQDVITTIQQIYMVSEIINVAVSDKETEKSHAYMFTRVQLYEILMGHIQEKFRRIQKCEDECLAFKVMEGTETAELKDTYSTLKRSCEVDLMHLHDSTQKADLDDAEATRRYLVSKEERERVIKEILQNQEDCWNRGDHKERQKLATDRFEEVKRRLNDIDNEARRRSERTQFKEMSSQYKKCLELTMENCDLAIRCVVIIEDIVKEACDAITARIDDTLMELPAIRMDV